MFKFRFRSFSALLCLALLFPVGALASCGRGNAPPPAAAAVLAAMQKAMADSVQTLPDGRVYSRAADPSAGEYLSNTLLSALYGSAMEGLLGSGGGSAPAVSDAPAISDAAVFLSLAPHPCELAVFRCSDARGTATMAKVCRARLEIIRNAWAGSEWEALTARAVVTVEGSYVFLIVADDPARVMAGARDAGI